MVVNNVSFLGGIASALLVLFLGTVVCAGQMSVLKVDHMKGTLLINTDRINSVYYQQKGDVTTSFPKVIYDGNHQGKELRGSAASSLWQDLQQNKSYSDLFLFVPHMDGTVGIPVKTIQSVYFTKAEGETPAQMRIVYDADTKVIKGKEAEKLWKRF